jgi:hypothetical protein
MVVIIMSNRSSIPKETAYEIIRETEKAVLIVYEEVYEGNESLTYVFFVPKLIIEKNDPKGLKGFFYRKTAELQEKVPKIEIVEEKEKAVKVSIDGYIQSAIWIPKNVFRANFDEACWKWILENKIEELEYDTIIEYENAFYSKKYARFIPNKWIIEIGGRIYVEKSKIEWLKSKKEK